MRRMRLIVGAGLAAGLGVAASSAMAQGFAEDFSVWPLSGWSIVNRSAPAASGTLAAWYQGVAPIFAAQAGAGSSYAMTGYDAGSVSGAVVSTWLITPVINGLKNGDTLTFWTRADTQDFPNRLQVRLSAAGASANVGAGATDVGDFSTLLLDVNPAYAVTGYPIVWTAYTATVSGLPGAVSGRLAFRFFLTSNLTQGGFVGVDTVQFTSVSAPACAANCDGSTTAPVLNALDFSCFLSRYVAAQQLPAAQQGSDYANCDGSTTAPVLNALDFSCFLGKYVAGCS